MSLAMKLVKSCRTRWIFACLLTNANKCKRRLSTPTRSENWWPLSPRANKCCWPTSMDWLAPVCWSISAIRPSERVTWINSKRKQIGLAIALTNHARSVYLSKGHPSNLSLLRAADWLSRMLWLMSIFVSNCFLVMDRFVSASTPRLTFVWIFKLVIELRQSLSFAPNAHNLHDGSWRCHTTNIRGHISKDTKRVLS